MARGILGKAELYQKPTLPVYKSKLLELKSILRLRLAKAVNSYERHINQDDMVKRYLEENTSANILIEYFLSYDEDSKNMFSEIERLKTIYRDLFGEAYVYEEEDLSLFKF
jgi:hypothetical protein